VIEPAACGAWRDLEARLRPFIARRVRTPVDVDDVVQDVFLRMQRGLAGLRDSERFGPWVYQVARSAIAEHQRTAAKHPLASADGAQELPADDDSVAEMDVSYIAYFVAALPSPYREALTLTELEGLTQQEAADMAGVSLSGMKSRVQRGREQLRRALEDCCHFALDVRGRVVACEPRPNGKLPAGCCEPRVAPPGGTARGDRETDQRAGAGATVAGRRASARSADEAVTIASTPKPSR
jgi:RNA polymerase sigma-70 factor, ECF subfamily